MQELAIVTDSTADLPPALAQEMGITIVPLKVIFGREVYRDGVDLDRTTFYQRLHAGEVATTSQPSPGEFEAAYRHLLTRAKSIVSIHISRRLSGTVNAAETARSLLPEADITVVDSRLVAGALGLVVRTAARAAQEGKPPAEVLSLIDQLITAIKVYFSIESLEYLRRGGRIGGAQALLGTILKINPILTLADGVIQPFEKVWGQKAALRRLAEIATAAAGNRPLFCQVLTGDNQETAAALASLLSGLPPGSTVETAAIGTVVAAHTGPGVYGIVFCPKRALEPVP
ncbi:DegV family protein with EDD domain [Thermodesulfitimonas autotrophica]|uniref:DegV family protein with EDD domain n=1 Tax=Thermodesulfitimonas autotrophica TaxID=1894989 RepID=A0A3N5BS16_9THEO|nr:DegV family protein [Thermodesulfitimonas autotrophica]RPF46551.1 DegV family protein with EDD domain [Thermodesulfitimonas autotrophica]